MLVAFLLTVKESRCGGVLNCCANRILLCGTCLENTHSIPINTKKLSIPSHTTMDIEEKLKRALGSCYTTQVSIPQNMELFRQAQMLEGSQPDEVYVQQVEELYKQWTEYTAVVQTIAATTPQKKGPDVFCNDQVQDYCDTVAAVVNQVVVMCPTERAPHLSRIIFSYKNEDKFWVDMNDEKWGKVSYIGAKFRYRIVREVLFRKFKMSCGADSWFVGMPVKSGKLSMVKSMLLGSSCVEKVVEGQLSFETPPFLQAMLSLYAEEHSITDPFLLMGQYMRLADDSPEVCRFCDEERRMYRGIENESKRRHNRNHQKHYQNAKGFMALHNKKQACGFATDVVMGRLRVSSCGTRDERFQASVLAHFGTLRDMGCLSQNQVAAAYLLANLIPVSVVHFYTYVVGRMLKAVPKQQGFIFFGAMNTGKSTVASALCDFMSGCALNVNCPRDRLWVEMGRCIDRFMVVFEDVMGVPMRGHTYLALGDGMSNLDYMREHLDGLFKVGLERKHQNKLDMYFPPWVVTCNHYVIPDSIKQRSLSVEFWSKKYSVRDFCKKWDIDLRFLSSGPCMLLMFALLGDEEWFIEQELETVKMWKDEAKHFDTDSMTTDMETEGEPDIEIQEDGTLLFTDGPSISGTMIPSSMPPLPVTPTPATPPTPPGLTPRQRLKRLITQHAGWSPADPGFLSSDDDADAAPFEDEDDREEWVQPKRPKRPCPFLDSEAEEDGEEDSGEWSDSAWRELGGWSEGSWDDFNPSDADTDSTCSLNLERWDETTPVTHRKVENLCPVKQSAPTHLGVPASRELFPSMTPGAPPALQLPRLTQTTIAQFIRAPPPSPVHSNEDLFPVDDDDDPTGLIALREMPGGSGYIMDEKEGKNFFWGFWGSWGTSH